MKSIFGAHSFEETVPYIDGHSQIPLLDDLLENTLVAVLTIKLIP